MRRPSAATFRAALEPPVYGPRPRRSCRLDQYKAYLKERVAAYPQLSGRRLLREIRDFGYDGSYTAVTDFLRTVRPAPTPSFEVRFETPLGADGLRPVPGGVHR